MLALLLTTLTLNAHAAPSLPTPPTDPGHPGSKLYSYTTKVETLRCAGRAVTVYLPERKSAEKMPVGKSVGKSPRTTYPTVVYGHGHALTAANYDGTFRHLAQKGIAVVYPTYDKNLFDQDFKRMGADFTQQTVCALKKYPQLHPDQVLYSGHAKGALVASIAAGSIAPNSPGAPRATILFELIGVDEESAPKMDPRANLTLIYGDADAVAERSFSERLFTAAPSVRKQLITVKSYTTTEPKLEANHQWPLTKGSVLGGGGESALHFYGAWKWLVAAAFDVRDGGNAANPYLYGSLANDKGAGLSDEITRNW